MNINGKNVLLAVLLCGLLGTVTGCEKKTPEPREDIAFTVCGKTQLPDALSEMIEEKKQHAFQISYATKEYLYIVVGYGAHDRANLQVTVEDLFKTDRAIYVKTNLETCEATSADAQEVGDASMYPYIVIRCERMELPVLFE